MAKSVFRQFPGDELDSSGTLDYYEGAAAAWVQDAPGQVGASLLAEFFEHALGPSYFGILKRWTGAAWVKAKLMRWNGGSWVAAKLKRWTGSGWVEVDATGA